MVTPTVASMPTAAMPTPYRPASEDDSQIIRPMVRIGTTTDCMPTAIPRITTVAGPVVPALAILRTGAPEV